MTLASPWESQNRLTVGGLLSILISAVICTHNRATHLAKAIQSLVDQRTPKDQYEIVVVDNHSTDSTQDAVRRFSREGNVRYIYEPVPGLSYARNTGWRNARGEYVAYLDDDAIACPVWLDKILEVFETIDPRPGCVGGKTEALWEAPRPAWLSDELMTGLTVIDWSEAPHTIPDLGREWLVGANIAFPIDILERMGGFVQGLDRAGKNLLSGGDVFMEKQILKAGYSCLYHPEIVVQHLVPKSRLEKRWFIRRYYSQGLSDAMLQLIERSLSPKRRIHLGLSKARRLLRTLDKLVLLVMPSNDAARFTAKCFVLITVGHIAGLLGAV